MLRRLTPYIKSDLARRPVFLAGPRQCGKTTLAKLLVSETQGEYLSWDDDQDQARIKQRSFAAGARLWAFDEIHKFLRWRNLLKGLIDRHHPAHQILVTGSARLELYGRGGDSLQGRYLSLRLHPVTLSELLGLQDEYRPERIPEMTAAAPDNASSELAALLTLGGFPEPLLSKDEVFAARWRAGYARRLVREEVRELEQVKQLDLIELLYERLPACVGSPLSINSLREDLNVSFDSAKRWLDILERLYGLFRLPPLGAARIKAVKKEQKLYLWDWSHIESDGARFENLIAFHLMRLTDWLNDVYGEKAELRYFRDVLGREVDFVILRRNKPWMAIEAKLSDTEPSPALRYLSERVAVPHLFQVINHRNPNYDRIEESGPAAVRVLSAPKFLANLP